MGILLFPSHGYNLIIMAPLIPTPHGSKIITNTKINQISTILSSSIPQLEPYDSLYRTFHANPELSGCEVETAARIAQLLRTEQGKQFYFVPIWMLCLSRRELISPTPAQYHLLPTPAATTCISPPSSPVLPRCMPAPQTGMVHCSSSSNPPKKTVPVRNPSAPTLRTDIFCVHFHPPSSLVLTWYLPLSAS